MPADRHAPRRRRRVLVGGCVVALLSLDLLTGAASARTGAEPAATPHDPEVVMVGDSLTYWGSHLLPTTWTVDGLRGREIGTLPRVLSRTLEEHPEPDVLLVALGSNETDGWRRRDLDDALYVVPPRTRVGLVTTYLDPAVFGAERARTQRRYSRWMRQVAEARPRSFVVDWRRLARADHALLRDGVHATRDGGEQVWADLLVRRAAMRH